MPPGAESTQSVNGRLEVVTSGEVVGVVQAISIPATIMRVRT
jgi:hypothetical protein